MTLCEQCASIDPDAHADPKADWDAGRYLAYRKNHKVIAELKHSRDMSKSAHNGCEGCRFFLDVVAQKCKNLDAFIDGAIGILITHHPGAYEIKSRTGRVSHFSIPVDLCLATELDYAYAHTPKLDGGRDDLLRPIAKDPSAEACFDMALSWLRKCSTHHSDCAKNTNVPLPTRLVDVGENCDSPPCPRLHIAQSDERGRYLTLSHCWGSGVKFRTTTSNIRELQRCIDFTSLSRNFQDAIVITRRLRFRYLWIDALCIVQDSAEDWALESSQMAQIYSNGALMLSASAAPDGEWGMLRKRDVLHSHRFGKRKQYIFQSRLERTEFNEHDSQPLDRRAWAYQERIMAPRILHFLDQKLLWECALAHWAEDTGLADLELDSQPRWLVKRQVEPFMRHSATSFPTSAEDLYDRLQVYYNCVETYSKRKLTKPTDKLPAFSGLASAFRVPELGAYLAGLWEADLVYGLAWVRDRHLELGAEQQAGEYIAPSWSWASTKRFCRINSLRSNLHEPEHQDLAFWKKLGADYKRWSEKYEPSLISYEYSLLTSDPHGKISAAAIVLRGYCRQLLVHKGRIARQKTFSAAAVLDQDLALGNPWKFGSPHEYFRWDDWRLEWAGGEEENVKQFTSLQIGMTTIGRADKLVLLMLILEDVEGLDNTYRRVGIIDVDLPDEEMMPDKWEIQDVRII